MAQRDRLLETIEALQVAGLDETRWPAALAAITGLFGAVGTTLERIDKSTRESRDFWSFGLPQACEMDYLDHFMSLSPRNAFGVRQKSQDWVGYDYMMLDENEMTRNPFYSEFLPQFDLRYFVSVTLNPNAREIAPLAVQRSPRQGHVGGAEIRLMRRLVPHPQHAFDTTMRLRDTGRRADTFRDTLDWLADGVMLLRADGTVAWANHAMQAIARAGDGIRITKDRVAFRSTEARSRFDAALGGIARLQADPLSAPHGNGFPVPRASAGAAYIVSLRPLARRAGDGRAVAIAFVRDPLNRSAAAYRLQREVLGLTPAEASLAQALQEGIPLSDYARRSALSLNTVYTHLRRIKEKAGSRRMAELIRKLNDLSVPPRPD